MRKTLKRLLIMLILVLSFVQSNISVIVVYASDTGIGIDDEFDELEGDGEYLGSSYRDNYYLDLEKTGLLDTGESLMNGMANVLFNLIRTFAFLTVSLFYYAMDFDVSALLSPQISGIQESLKSGIFEPLLLLAIVGTFCIMVVKFWKRDMSGIAGEFFKILLVMVLALAVVKDSANAMSFATKVTKSISVSIINGVNSGYGIEGEGNYSAQASGVLWVNLVHEPWKSLEFGKTVPSNEEVKSFLELSPGDDRRLELIKEFRSKDSFAKTRGATRVAFCLTYLIPFIIKCALYIVVALIQIAYQVVAVFFLLFAPIVLLLALIPGYDMDLVGVWLRKILDTQISVLIITFLLALLIKIDEVLYSLSPKYGWFPVLIFQTAIGVVLFYKRNELLTMINGIQKTVKNPGALKEYITRSGNPLDMAEDIIKRDPAKAFVTSAFRGFEEYNYEDDENPGSEEPLTSSRSFSYSQSSGENYIVRPTTYDETQEGTSPSLGSDHQKEEVRKPRAMSVHNISMSSQALYDLYENEVERPYSTDDPDRGDVGSQSFDNRDSFNKNENQIIRPYTTDDPIQESRDEIVRPTLNYEDQSQTIRPISMPDPTYESEDQTVRPVSTDDRYQENQSIRDQNIHESSGQVIHPINNQDPIYEEKSQSVRPSTDSGYEGNSQTTPSISTQDPNYEEKIQSERPNTDDRGDYGGNSQVTQSISTEDPRYEEENQGIRPTSTPLERDNQPIEGRNHNMSSKSTPIIENELESEDKKELRPTTEDI